MCGHGLIGVVRTLAHLGRLHAGVARFDTPVGTVSAELNADGSVTIENVASRCHALDVEVDVPGIGRVVGDVGYGGNWFFHHASAAVIRDLECRRADARYAGDPGRDHGAARGRRRPDRPHRGRRARRRDPTPTRETSCSARAANTIARRAERGRRR